MPRKGFKSSLPSLFRPPSIRTCVRVTARSSLFGRRSPRSNRGVAVLDGGPATPGHVPERARARDPQEVRCLVGISTDHFDPYAAVRGGRCPKPLDQILVQGSTFSRGHLKTRLYEAGLKQRICELCGQGEIWRGVPTSMILDHINGVSDDNRLENLRIVCPNCAATFDTHCARGRKIVRVVQDCLRCGVSFLPKTGTQRYCSRECGSRWDRSGIPRPGARRVDRPPYPQLMREVRALGFCATGRATGD
jgi:hypothetical protein